MKSDQADYHIYRTHEIQLRLSRVNFKPTNIIGISEREIYSKFNAIIYYVSPEINVHVGNTSTRLRRHRN